MRSADAEPNIRGASSGHDCYRLFRVADRSADHDRRFLSATFRRESLGSGGLVTPVAIEGAFVLPGCPDDAGEAVGECDRGFVVTALAFAVQRPVPQAVEGFAGTLRPVGREQ